MESTELREGLRVCVAYLCARLEEIEEEIIVNHVHISETGLRALVNIGRDLAAAIEAIEEAAAPQELVVRFTDSESEPQDTACEPGT